MRWGICYHEHVVIEVSSKKRDFNFYLLFEQLDIIFKLFGLTPKIIDFVIKKDLIK